LISYGKDRPTDPASTPEAWAKNRNAITMVQ
jgi:peptidoglycan-associated lipoprotein